MSRFLFTACLACLALQAQYKRSTTCKFLTPDEAAAVIGSGAKLETAIEDGGCTYKRGPLTLTVAQPVRMSDRKILTIAFEASSEGGKAKPVAGIGDRAHIKKGNSGYQIMYLKGNAMGGVEVYGDGSDSAAMAEKLKEAAQKASGRL
jgi:hypothetical protein